MIVRDLSHVHPGLTAEALEVLLDFRDAPTDRDGYFEIPEAAAAELVREGLIDLMGRRSWKVVADLSYAGRELLSRIWRGEQIPPQAPQQWHPVPESPHEGAS